MRQAPPGRVVGIVVAAGTGERLGAGMAKAFVEVAGVPLLARAATALARSGAVGSLVAVVGAGDEQRAREVLAAAGLHPRAVCTGGATRQQSVRHGLAALEAADEIVAVHDAARPLASPGLVASVVAAVRPPVVAAAPGLPVVDTVKLVHDERGRVERTVDRARLWAVQTPQVFDRATLEAAHAAASGEATDDLVLVEQAGGHVRLVPGERRNFKVTYPDDLAMAEALAAAPVARGGA